MDAKSEKPRLIRRRRFIREGAAGLGLGSLAAPAFVSALAGAEERVRMGFIGVGGRGTTHLKTILEVPGVEVTWVCDIDPTALDRASNVVGEKTGKKPSSTEQHARVLAAKDVDAVLIATPCDAHAALYLDTIRAGKDLYAEKPMAITVAECDEIVKAAADSRSLVQVGFQSRYSTRVRDAIERIHRGDIGEVIEVRASFLAAFGPLRGWFSRRARSGDWMVEQAVHHFDIWNWALRGVAERAFGWGRKDIYNADEPDRDVHDYYSALLEYPGSVKVSWVHSWLCPGGGIFNKNFIHILGRRGGVDVLDGRLEYLDRNRPKESLAEEAANPTRLAHEAFLECVRTRKPPFSNVQNGRDAVLVGLLVREAVEKRRLAEMAEIRKA